MYLIHDTLKMSMMVCYAGLETILAYRVGLGTGILYGLDVHIIWDCFQQTVSALYKSSPFESLYLYCWTTKKF